MKELFIVLFIPKLLFFQGAKLSKVALASSKLLLKAKRVQECGSEVEAPNVGALNGEHLPSSYTTMWSVWCAIHGNPYITNLPIINDTT